MNIGLGLSSVSEVRFWATNMLISKLTESVSLSVQTTLKVIGDEKLSNSLLCYSSGGRQEKSVWVILGQATQERVWARIFLFFFNFFFPWALFPWVGRAERGWGFGGGRRGAAGQGGESGAALKARGGKGWRYSEKRSRKTPGVS